MNWLQGIARRLVCRPLALGAIAGALALAAAPPARAETWSFAYTGSGISAAGTFTGTWTGSFYTITAITGTRNGVPITGLFGSNNYYVAILGTYIPSLKIQFNTTTGKYTLGWVDWSYNANLGAYIGYPGGVPVGTEASHPTFSPLDTRDNHVGTLAYGLCDRGRPGCAQVSLRVVPEIAAAGAAGPLALFLLIALIFREMFSRRRAALAPPTTLH